MKDRIIKHINFLEKIVIELELKKDNENLGMYGMLQAYKGEIEMLKGIVDLEEWGA